MEGEGGKEGGREGVEVGHYAHAHAHTHTHVHVHIHTVSKPYLLKCLS